MSVSAAELAAKKCVACDGRTPPLTADQVAELMPAVPGWELAEDGTSIRRRYRMPDFLAALAFFGRIAAVAEADDHHPDLHLTGYRNALVELSTHAVGGLTANDFIVAAKIDRLTEAGGDGRELFPFPGVSP